MTRILNGQVIFALTLTALNTVYASQVLQMDRPFASGEPGPAFLPSMLCIFIYLAVARILFTEIRAQAPAATDAIQSEHVPHIRLVGPLIAVGLTVLFIIGFFYLGYLVSAFLYTFMIAFFFDFERRGAWRPWQRSGAWRWRSGARVTLWMAPTQSLYHDFLGVRTNERQVLAYWALRKLFYTDSGQNKFSSRRPKMCSEVQRRG